MNWLFDLFDNRTFGAARSSDWSTFQKAHIEKNCRCCGALGTFLNPLNLHHISPFHKDPSKEKDPNNVITLCRICHFLIGHLKNWSSWNVSVVADAAMILSRIKNRP